MSTRDTRRDAGDDAAARRPAKKRYAPPRLIEYGSTSKLSAAKPGPNADGANVAMKTGCL
jgi:hypothetical protein